MTDFVDRLLGRSTLPPVRPLLPTLFEPTRRDDTEDLPPGRCTSAAAVDRAPARDDGVRHEETRAPEAGPDRLSAPSVIQMLVEAHDGDPVPPVWVESREIVNSTLIRDNSVRTTTHEKTIARPVVERDTPAVVVAIPEPRAVQPIVRGRADIPSPPRTVARMPVPRTVEPSRREAVSARRAQRDPDVHVTIGRIEITAAPPQQVRAPRGDTGARPPRISLEDYLRAREV